MIQIGDWVAVLLTISVYTNMLYGDNKFFKFSEATLIGVVLANQIVVNVYSLIDKTVVPIMQGNILRLIMFIGGMMLLLRLWDKYSWVSRYSMSILVGIGTGLSLLGSAETNFWKILEGTFVPLVGGKYLPIDNLYGLIATVCVISYFFFTYKSGKNVGYVQNMGRHFMMFAFGAYFGNTILTRLTWLSARIGYIIQFFLDII